MRVLFVVFAVAIASLAQAKDAEGIPVTVRVTDAAGSPVSTAVVRPVADETRHRVNTATGEWTESVLYLQDGSELKFLKGTLIELEVSAPGFVNQPVKYEVRKRGNVVPVQLIELEDDPDDEVDTPIIGFGRTQVLDK